LGSNPKHFSTETRTLICYEGIWQYYDKELHEDWITADSRNVV